MECAPVDDGTSLYFDVSIDHEHGGPVCNWPDLVDCTNNDRACDQCKPSEKCIRCEDCPDCPGRIGLNNIY